MKIKRKKQQKCFVFEVKLISGSWGHDGEIGLIPVFASTEYHANEKFSDHMNNSESPNYTLLSIKKSYDYILPAKQS